MRIVVQRVSQASVAVEGKEVGSTGPGLLLLAAVHRDDDEAAVRKSAEKVLNLRIFSDADGKMNLSILDKHREAPHGILAISNFTVYGDAEKQRRPSFMDSAGYEQGQRLFEAFLEALRTSGLPVATGVFGAHMDVSLTNDGPVTIILG